MCKKSRVWFVTGSSQGLGRAIVETALKNGDRVVAASRKVNAFQDLVHTWNEQILPVVLDVTNKKQIQDAVVKTMDVFGQIDVLVNNAGYGLLGAVEEVSEQEEQQLFQVNVFGLLAVTRSILPIMRKQRSGHIINMSSIAGIAAGTGSGLYAASKFAVEGLSEALSSEAAALGIKVTIVEPGQFRTNFLGDSLRVAEQHLEDYRSTAGAMKETLLNQNGLQQGDPAKAAEAILRAVEMEHSTLRLPLGPDCLMRLRKKLDSVEEDIQTWENITLNTGYKEGTVH
ncbi:oxidoreductase [Paenibacillus sp. VMFN-D1]|uniref:oxidoreductase n=1 Tax=Paenibacillus sp. VMFN-D1 TaxID=2135608 RepID=UPI000E270F6C|nr:oxidoreductase [Paenibacillus sp. VMFN-D1]RED37421.1 NADP-dependent 3-hydroxy acid dehydrogenase YdfG [Paenibacillus sp. VMFN-D1]